MFAATTWRIQKDAATFLSAGRSMRAGSTTPEWLLLLFLVSAFLACHSTQLQRDPTSQILERNEVSGDLAPSLHIKIFEYIPARSVKWLIKRLAEWSPKLRLRREGSRQRKRKSLCLGVWGRGEPPSFQCYSSKQRRNNGDALTRKRRGRRQWRQPSN